METDSWMEHRWQTSNKCFVFEIIGLCTKEKSIFSHNNGISDWKFSFAKKKETRKQNRTIYVFLRTAKIQQFSRIPLHKRIKYCKAHILNRTSLALRVGMRYECELFELATTKERLHLSHSMSKSIYSDYMSGER